MVRNDEANVLKKRNASEGDGEVINGNNGRERQECVAEIVSKARYPCNPNLSAGLGWATRHGTVLYSVPHLQNAPSS